MKKHWFLLIGMLASMGCGELAQEEETLEQVEQEISIENWQAIDLLTLDLTNGTYRAIEASARAVFEYEDKGSNKPCTAFMISDDYAITAWHCVEDSWDRKKMDYVNDGSFDVEGTLGPNFYFKRAFQLGLVLKPDQSIYDFKKVKCKHQNEWEKFDRDQAVLRCQETTTANAVVPIGAIYGHVETQILPFSENSSAALVAVNQSIIQTSKQNLWSNATITDTNVITPCGGWSGVFEHTGYVAPGSSGAPVFNKASQAARGVHRGKCTGVSNNNNGTLFPPQLSDYRDITPIQQTLTKDTSNRNSSWVGNIFGGVEGELNCPANYAVVGLIGDSYEHATYADGNLGTLGIICAPYWVQTSATPRLQTTNYTVHTKGSYNNNFQAYSGDYNYFKLHNPFINELHCEPGQYLRGARINKDLTNNKINHIEAIFCKKPNVGTLYSRDNVRPDNKMGRLTGGSASSTLCTYPIKAATGMKVRSGWYTDAFAFLCDTF